MDPRIDPIELISKQLGRKPSIAFTVAVRCPFDWPAVLLNEAANPAGEPNPNLYYISCPHLRREIARLEDTGFAGSLEEILRSDEDLASDLKKAQEEHRREWMRAAKDAKAWQSAGLAVMLKRTGNHAPNIAATRDDLSIKCLHAHMAWFLVHPDYRLGKIIAARLRQIWCSDETCRRLFYWPE